MPVCLGCTRNLTDDEVTRVPECPWETFCDPPRHPARADSNTHVARPRQGV